MPAEVERKLAAILSADAVAYSRLMAEGDRFRPGRLARYCGSSLRNCLGAKPVNR